MPHATVSSLNLNTRLRKEPYLLRDKTVRMTRGGERLLLVTLGDRTGSISGIYFGAPLQVVESLRSAEGVEVTGAVDEHQGQLQVRIERIEPTVLANLNEYLPSPHRPLDEMKAEFDALLASVEQPDLARLLSAIFDDPETYSAFTQAPAAKRFHHATYGGLLEHTLSVVRLVLAASDLYQELDRDLAVTVALLHDLGKIRAYNAITFDLTEEGILFNHLPIGAGLVDKAIDSLADFPAELRLRVVHAILAHHGDLDKGSPVRPKTLEAIVLHYADNLDGDARGAIDHMDRDGHGEGAFTARSQMHDGELYRGEL